MIAAAAQQPDSPSPLPPAPCSEARYGALLAPYLADPANLFIISSDFCHWGSRFSYTFYDNTKVGGWGHGSWSGHTCSMCHWPCRAVALDKIANRQVNCCLPLLQYVSLAMHHACAVVAWHEAAVHLLCPSATHRAAAALTDLLPLLLLPLLPLQGAIWESIQWLDHEGLRAIESGDAGAFREYLAQYRNTVCGRHPIAVLLNMLPHCSAKFSISTQCYDQSSKCMRTSDSSVSYVAAIVAPA